MRTEDSPEYIDAVAQAVIDKIEERDRLALVVERVARRVLEMQQEQAEAIAEEATQGRDSSAQDSDTQGDT